MGRRRGAGRALLLLLVLALGAAAVAAGAAAAEEEAAAAAAGETEAGANDGICYSMDIRNRIEAFRLLSGCRVVEGFVQIVLLDNTSEADFEALSFPRLREITRYLLLFRVAGLRSLGALFPNLTVIRGAALFRDYALVVFELFALRDLGLRSLALIERGGVRVEKNDNLCFASTVDWKRLAPNGEVVVTANGQSVNCLEQEKRVCNQSGCPLGPAKGGAEEAAAAPWGCWGPGACQRPPPDADADGCSAQCLGGCWGPGPRRCHACRHVLSPDGACVQRCPPDSYLYLGRRCVTRQQCERMRDLDQATVLRQREQRRNASGHAPAPAGALGAGDAAAAVADALLAGADDADNPRYWTFNGSCVNECRPANVWEEAPGGGGGCRRCVGRCRRVCPGAMVDSLAAAQELRGCTHIDGPLVLQLPAGGAELAAELNRSLADIEEIADYLKVWRSFALLSLDFLSRLRTIGGRSLLDRYALKVVENQNLRRLWAWAAGGGQGSGGGGPRFRILNGSVLFHANPKLCRAHIDRLVREAGLNASLQVIQSNGDHEVCESERLLARVAMRRSHGAVVHWEPPAPSPSPAPGPGPAPAPGAPQPQPPPPLLGFLVYFREAPFKNVTRSSGREVCGAEGWQVQDAGRRAALEARLADPAPAPGRGPGAAPGSTPARWLSAPLTKLKPYTQYAFYVTTYSQTSSGASSDIVYFTTLPAQPSMPRVFAAEALPSPADGDSAGSSPAPTPATSPHPATDREAKAVPEVRVPRAAWTASAEEGGEDAAEQGQEPLPEGEEAVVLSWLPPSEPNGRLTYYVVRGAQLPDPPDPLRDYCADLCDGCAPETGAAPPLPPVPPHPPPAPAKAPAVAPRGQCSAPGAGAASSSSSSSGPPGCACAEKRPPLRAPADFSKHCAPAALAAAAAAPGAEDDAVDLEEECSRFVQGALEALATLPDPEALFMDDPLDFPAAEKEGKDHVWGMDEFSNEPSSTDTQRTHLFQFEVAGGARGLVVRGLLPFSRLALTLSACRAPDAQPRSACSAAALAVTRTRARPAWDALPSAPALGPAPAPVPAPAADPATANATVAPVPSTLPAPPRDALWASWPAPRRPNGHLLLFSVQWRRANQEGAAGGAACVSARAHAAGGGGALVRGLPAGAAVQVRVRARSQGGQGPWSAWSAPRRVPASAPPLRPDADGDGDADPDADADARARSHAPAGLVGALVAAALVAVGACAAGGVLWLRGSRRRRLRHLFATVNPDYGQLAGGAGPGPPLYDESWEVAPERVQVLRELGRGSFGRVAEALLLPEGGAHPEGQPAVRCAAKAVAAAGGRARAEALNEAAAMKAFREGAHLVRLLGVVSRARPPLVLMELMPRGDLKRVLQAARRVAPRARPLPRHLLAAAAQVADGMAFLEAHKFVHRDLAARNCMVARDGVVKVGDFGMARDVYETDYYRAGARGLLPVRWMAPESLADGVFSARSDAWAFGVVVWEAAALAQQPYQGLANEQVLDVVLQGGVLAPPAGCPAALARLMAICWCWRPADRPPFLRLVRLIEEEALALPPDPAPRDQEKGGAWEEEEEEEEEAEEEGGAEGAGAGIGVSGLGAEWQLGGGLGEPLVRGLPASFHARAFAHSAAGEAAAAALDDPADEDDGGAGGGGAGGGGGAVAQPAMLRSRAHPGLLAQDLPTTALYVAPRGGEEEKLLLPQVLAAAGRCDESQR